MTEDRLLTDEEIDTYLEMTGSGVKLATSKLLKAQDLKTRTATLKEVGEWLNKKLPNKLYGNYYETTLNPEALITIKVADVLKLLKGEMP